MSSIENVLQISDPTTFSIALIELLAQGPRSLTQSRPAELVVWYVSALESEVNNGGFSLFFMNSAGDRAVETLDALRQLGARKMMGLLSDAIAVFPPPGPSPNRETRQKQIDTLPPTAQDIWNRLDQEFYRYPDDLPSLMRSFVKSHVADFR